jgi:hypothetical protein
MTRIGRVLLVLAAASFPGFGTTVYYIETGQTGAALDIDIISSDTWMFTPSYSWDLGGGIFTMKKGSATAASITLTLNDVTNNISSLTSVTLDPSSFTQSYAPVTFAFSLPYTLTAGVQYSLVLSSPANNSSNEKYLIKDDGTSGFFDDSGNPLPPPPPVPEPATLSTLAAGILALIGLGRRSFIRRAPR